jgi:hypothetical protein
VEEAMHPWESVWNVNWMVVSWVVTLVVLGVLAWAVIKGGIRRK